MDEVILRNKIIEIHKGDSVYPNSLLSLEDTPETIYARGDVSILNSDRCFAVVGSRKVSLYGEKVVSTLVHGLVKNNFIIVSGFMYGVDSLAHQATLFNRGRTIAVLGYGLNTIYPTNNAVLYRKVIQEGGCVISEYPPEFKPRKWTFPKRNRIVAALSTKGVLVIEAAEYSGSLITASYADALNRPLYAVPGSIFSETSRGANLLIKTGVAKAVSEIEDIISS